MDRTTDDEGQGMPGGHRKRPDDGPETPDDGPKTPDDGPEIPDGDRGTDDGTARRVWIVSADGTDCSHLARGLRYVGGDGRNTYHRCEECGAVVVAGDGLVREARALGRSSQ